MLKPSAVEKITHEEGGKRGCTVRSLPDPQQQGAARSAPFVGFPFWSDVGSE